MQPVFLSIPLRRMACLGMAAAAIITAGSVSADPYSYQVVNDTLSGGDPVFPVTNPVTFKNLLLTETFFDNSTAAVPLLDFTNTPLTALDVNTIELDSAVFTLPDPVHGDLTGAVLTGSFTIDGLVSGPTLDLTIQPNLDPASQSILPVYTKFSADLFAAPPYGPAAGTFSLLDASGAPVRSVPIVAVAVPEPSTSCALVLLSALLLGQIIVVRRGRRSAVAAAK